ncbi:glycoside hydrolase family 30 beta sandwich domain-containing protein [Bacteroides sp.]|uniref:glycoside hydrolase family 30 protein n=1 Tax=Bacteroides sp. TaxID=29523 RepID=UPI0026034393|nr:glycoside hydrolase family 30 beta sandwich domain-containing protein [Bacteroides sp.]MDD3039953.1 glycoside hydrolase family 30 beta sandwich domain-containing protein [Bacteroides sp.]
MDAKKGKRDVALYVTTANLTHDLTRESIPFNKKNNQTPATIVLNPAVRYQEMDGFGAAITGSTCYNLLMMKPEDRRAFLTETFSSKKGFGFSYIRVSIGCSDFSLSEYTCCDQKGMENFALQSEETDYIIPVLKEILTINPSIKIMAAPWTCPKWMKVKSLNTLVPLDSWTDGQLNPIYYKDYATYFVKWIQAFNAEGIEIYAVTPQNEPLNRKNSASLYMGWEEQRDFIKTALGPQMKAAGLTTRIYTFDHNYNYDNIESQKDYPCKIYEDTNASQYIAGSAFHNYGGDRKELLNVHNAHPDKELLFTETSIGTWNSGRDLPMRLMDDMREVALGTVNNWCKSVIVWNLMLDNDRGPNREGGCQTCYGAVDINNSDYKTIIRNSHYYIIAHLSTVVKPGAYRIGALGQIEKDIIYSAFENVDGTYALVLLNRNEKAQAITVSDGHHQFTHDVPGKSVISYCWAK